MHPKNKIKSAFSNGYRRFQFRRPPFGLATVPSTIQCTMNCVLSWNTWSILKKAELLDQSGYHLNIDKCEFTVQRFMFVRFMITPKGTRPIGNNNRNSGSL